MENEGDRVFVNPENRKSSAHLITKSQVIADLHIHSRFSRATSKDLNLENLEKYARIKGVDILGTGDFQHPKWSEELDKLDEREGILHSQSGFKFVWQTEISLMYSQDGKGRRVHLIILAPNKEVAKQITEFLGSKGRLDYDGRPIFGFSSIELVAELMKISPKIEIIPAHIWTPWFGVFGSNSGFDSLKDAFGDQAKNIHAIETGMSSDPKMNWRIKELDDKSIVSFSDLHSFWPWRIGREATILNPISSYDDLIRQIREKSFLGTIEVDPAYGKYHWDGHRNCNFSCSPEKSKELGGKCPQCGKSLTIGVEYRVEELADKERGFGFNLNHGKKFHKLLPLHELIVLAYSMGIATKRSWEIYNHLIEKFGNEFNVLLNVGEQDLARNFPKENLLRDLILKNRIGKISVRPGFDGEYGVAVLDAQQKTLF